MELGNERELRKMFQLEAASLLQASEARDAEMAHLQKTHTQLQAYLMEMKVGTINTSTGPCVRCCYGTRLVFEDNVKPQHFQLRVITLTSSLLNFECLDLNET